MHYAKEINLLGILKSVMTWLCLLSILLLSHCNCRYNPTSTERTNVTEPTMVPPEEPYEEIVIFYGTPGTGKSALLNSIVQGNIFPSGLTRGAGLTRSKQEHIHENRKYIDTPGLADIRSRKQAAQEIEKALKENKDSKIVFVATLDSGRIRLPDLEAINTICEAIRAPFEYGIIFNKVSQEVLESCNQNKQTLVAAYLPMLKKQPLSHLIIENDETMEVADNIYLPSDSKSKKELVDFIANLPPNRIPADQVTTVQGETCDERVKQMEIQKREAEAAEQAALAQQRDAEERIRRAQDQQRDAEQRIRRAQDQQRDAEKRIKKPIKV